MKRTNFILAIYPVKFRAAKYFIAPSINLNALIKLFLLLTLCSGKGSIAQIITFQKSFHGTNTGIDKVYSVVQTPDSGYVLAGFTTSFGAGNLDVYLVKTNVNGDTLWTKTYGGSGNDYAQFVGYTSDGGYIICGSTNSFGAGQNDIYLIKTNSVGDTLWAKTYGGINFEEGFYVQSSTDGGYIILGYTTSFGAGQDDIYLIKTNSIGDTLWTKTYGGTNYDDGQSVHQTSDGGYIIAGYTASFGAGQEDVFVIKTNANGDTLWTKTYGGTGVDDGISILQTPDNGYVIAGYTNSFGAGNGDVYLIKIDSSGNLKWSKTYGGTNYDFGYCVQQTTDGKFVIAGTTQPGIQNNDFILIKSDSIGTFLWAKTYGGTNIEFGYSVQQTLDEGYIMCGYTKSFGTWAEDVYLVKTDSAGNSGCNESTPNISVNSPTTVVTSPLTLLSAGGIINNSSTIISSGGIAKDVCPPVNINENDFNDDITISPNPFFTQTVMKIKGYDSMEKVKKVEIYDAFGIKVHSSVIRNSDSFVIRRDNLASGIYFYRVVFEHRNSVSGKIVIE